VIISGKHVGGEIIYPLNIPGIVMIDFDFPWCSPPINRVLENNEAHIWRATLDREELEVESFRRTLSKDERDRAESFHFQRDKGRFIVSRGILRTILACYINKDPSEIVFCYGAFGKPALAEESGLETFHFNLAYSHGLALYVIIKNQQVGIDIERIRSDFGWESIAKQYFCAEEYATLLKLPIHLREEGFFNYWTCKETYIKATGQGLSLPLNEVEISLINNKPTKLLNMLGEQKTIFPLVTGETYTSYWIYRVSCCRKFLLSGQMLKLANALRYRGTATIREFWFCRKYLQETKRFLERYSLCSQGVELLDGGPVLSGPLFHLPLVNLMNGFDTAQSNPSTPE
jgi:4'-phosphopantetheinyl transferase